MSKAAFKYIAITATQYSFFSPQENTGKSFFDYFLHVDSIGPEAIATNEIGVQHLDSQAPPGVPLQSVGGSEVL